MRKLVGALDAGVTDMTDFFRVKKLPLFVVELGVKVYDEPGMGEVEKSIANIAIILKNEIKSTL
jgi:hypothetical protein